MQHTNWPELRVLAAVFLKLGATSFGGPLAHIARMEDEIVTRRGWMDRQHFLDLVGATNLIPGPNSTELAIHIGRERAGRAGLVVAGAAFILPAMLIVLALASLYSRYGNVPQARSLFYGIQPVVIAIVAQALWKFSGTAFKGPFTIAVALVSVLLVSVKVPGFAVSEVGVIALAATAGLIAGLWQRSKTQGKADGQEKDLPRPLLGKEGSQGPDSPPYQGGVGGGSAPSEEDAAKPTRFAPILIPLLGASAAPSLGGLFLVFLKIGSVIYGSGYVLLAFLHADFVERLGWLTDKELLDAVAIGQMTPGPVFTTATFIGYLIGERFELGALPCALVATLGIFLPSFVFVDLLSVVLHRLRTSLVMRSFLDSVNAASLALMAVVTFQLLRTSVVDATTLALALTALVTLVATRINSAWLIAAGALVGLWAAP